MRYTILLVLAIATVHVYRMRDSPLIMKKRKAAIIAVMEKETQTYIERDFEGYVFYPCAGFSEYEINCRSR